ALHALSLHDALPISMVAASLAHAAPPTAQGTSQSQPATASGPPNALQGFSQNRDKPIKISSASLEVRDKDKVATFSGDVHLVQRSEEHTSELQSLAY